MPRVGGTEVGLRGGEDIGLSTEAADAFDLADEGGNMARLVAIKFGGRRSVAEQPRKFLIIGGLELREPVPGLAVN